MVGFLVVVVIPGQGVVVVVVIPGQEVVVVVVTVFPGGPN